MQTYKICNTDLSYFSKTKDVVEEQQQTSKCTILKKDNGKWFSPRRLSPVHNKDSVPSITTISQMRKQTYQSANNIYAENENWYYRFNPITASWPINFRPILENKSIGTVPSSGSIKSDGLLKHRSTITTLSGSGKETRDAANFVAPCPKHIHRLALPPFKNPLKQKDTTQFADGQKINKCPLVTKGQHFTIGTQVSLIFIDPKNVNNMYKTNDDISIRSKVKNGKTKHSGKSNTSISSWDYFDDRLPENRRWEEKRITGISTRQRSNPILTRSKQELYKNLDSPSAQMMTGNGGRNYFPGKKYNKQLFHVYPMQCSSNYKHPDIEEDTELHMSSKPERVIPTVRNSSGTLNYNEIDNQESRMNNYFSSGLPKKNTYKLPDSDEFVNRNSQLTSSVEAIPATFKDSIPKCSLHNNVGCQNSICKTKSSYLLRRHRYYEAIMDQVHYIKRRIKSLNFTLRDVEQLFSLIEKANEDLMNYPEDPKDKLLAKKNKLKWEGFHKKVKSSKDETKYTLDTIKQLEQLFDTVLMNIEMCENKFDPSDKQLGDRRNLQLSLIELEENLKEFEFLRNCKKGWIHKQLILLNDYEMELIKIRNILQSIILS
ncbi:uncharacterized protein LOC130904039 isoform X2 [Diorhabda carinulata]|uniref:uncharacterized protein LOC130904039 isoform X2 n=1 Tax=Diorhabda carinulata TaxID=1163345 RepID=UPI0025A144AA|nr:uncharacterized protein LOC130904039 isoform X2 [Diorhabda carinulata]